jgi:hypothetical protein
MIYPPRLNLRRLQNSAASEMLFTSGLLYTLEKKEFAACLKLVKDMDYFITVNKIINFCQSFPGNKQV